MSLSKRLERPLWQCAAGLALVVIATLVRLPFEGTLQGRAPFATFFPVIILMGWLGPGPTSFTALLSFVSALYFIIPPRLSFAIADPADGAALVLLLLVSAAVVVLSDANRVFRRRALDALANARRAERIARAAAWHWEPGERFDGAEELCSLLGLPPGSLRAPGDVAGSVHPDDRARYEEALSDARLADHRLELEYRILHPQLGERWLHTTGEGSVDRDGRPESLSGLTLDITERRLAERAHASLAAIVESSDDAIIGKDLDGVICSWNAGAERLYGYTAAEIVGQNVTKLVPPDRHEEEERILQQLRRGERVEHFESVRVAKDGRKVDVSLTISPIRDASGRVVGASKIARDITERKRAQEEIRRHREWLQVTLSSIGDGVIACSPDCRVSFLNPVAERLTGWAGADAVGQPLDEVFRIVDESTLEPAENPCEKVLRTGRVQTLANHTALLSRGGGQVPIADSGAPILDDHGEVLGVVLVFRDVSEERRAEEAVAEQREWFRTTLESIGDAVIATDVHGRVVFLNPEAERLTGWPLARAEGRECSEVFCIVDENTREAVSNPVTRVLREGSVQGLAKHTALLSADGSEHPIDDSGAPIRDRSGRVVGAVLVFRDVSERRQSEDDRTAAAEERDRLLESERAARSEAERANRLKDEFIATVSHELRNPLNAIVGWTHILSREPQLGERTRKALDVIDRNARAQARLISDLLDMSRIMSGKIRLELSRLSLVTLVQDSIVAVRAAAAAKQIEITTTFSDAVDGIVADPERLQQVLWNLLSNAVKFTPAGGHVTVSLRRDGTNAEIRVSDDGIGIEPEHLLYVFNRFQQAEPSTTRRHGGLGLGLSIARNLVEMHGGSIRAESAGKGAGATFVVTLPIRPAGAPAEEPAIRPLSGARFEALTAQELRDVDVLVVEDEPDTRDLVRRVLEESGARVTTAATAQDALSAFALHRPDVVVSDIGLPEVDGLELIARLRAMESPDRKFTPAIALTAFARAEDRTRALRAGYQTHLAKPVTPAELVATIVSISGLVTSRKREAPRPEPPPS